MGLKLEFEEGIPVAYIDLVDGRKDSDSVKQEVIYLEQLTFTPRSLIFDFNKAGRVIGVELLG